MNNKTINNRNENINYLYIINYTDDEKSLCNLEMKSIFGEEIKEKYIISPKRIPPSDSPFIKERLRIDIIGESKEDILEKVKRENISCEDFKVVFVKSKTDEIDYEERLKLIKSIGMEIKGEANIYEPKVSFGVTILNGKWIFGEYEKHDNEWHLHDKKPFTYSNGLNFKIARSIISIASGNDKDLRIIDPCCGVGTLVMEGLSKGLNIEGFEINPMIGDNAKRNLSFFDYRNVIKIMDMHTCKEHYDVSIIDIPYGLFNPITEKEQREIIRTARKISDKLVIVTYVVMDEMLEGEGFKVVDRCTISKGKFKRYLTVCV